jgi:transposase-like protein
MAKGRPSIYNPEFTPRLAAAYIEQGLSESKAAERLGVSEAAWNSWKNKHKEFKEALKNAKVKPDCNVERSLYERAIGYEYQEVTLEPEKRLRNKPKADGSYTEPKLVPIKIVRKKALPDVQAQIFWLVNRKKDEWKQRQSIDGELKNEYTIILPEELAAAPAKDKPGAVMTKKRKESE